MIFLDFYDTNMVMVLIRGQPYWISMRFLSVKEHLFVPRKINGSF